MLISREVIMTVVVMTTTIPMGTDVEKEKAEEKESVVDINPTLAKCSKNSAHPKMLSFYD